MDELEKKEELEPVVEEIEEVVEEPKEESAEEVVEKFTEEPAEEVVEEPIEEPAEEATEEPAEETVEEAETEESPVEKTAEKGGSNVIGIIVGAALFIAFLAVVWMTPVGKVVKDTGVLYAKDNDLYYYDMKNEPCLLQEDISAGGGYNYFYSAWGAGISQDNETNTGTINLFLQSLKTIEGNKIIKFKKGIYYFSGSIDFTGINDLYFVGVEIYAKWYIISPIASSDYAKLFEMSEDSFVEYIISKDVFKNMVEHVKKNNKNRTVTQDEIIEGYKRFIREYYSIIKSREVTTP